MTQDKCIHKWFVRLEKDKVTEVCSKCGVYRERYYPKGKARNMPGGYRFIDFDDEGDKCHRTVLDVGMN